MKNRHENRKQSRHIYDLERHPQSLMSSTLVNFTAMSYPKDGNLSGLPIERVNDTIIFSNSKTKFPFMNTLQCFMGPIVTGFL